MAKFKNISGENRGVAYGCVPQVVAAGGEVNVQAEAAPSYRIQTDIWEETTGTGGTPDPALTSSTTATPGVTESGQPTVSASSPASAPETPDTTVALQTDSTKEN